MYSDLHLHSKCSDGAFTPTELVQYAAKHAITVMALTDHDTISGVGEAATAAKEVNIEFIPGVEISSNADKVMPSLMLGSKAELHLLGLGFCPHPPASAPIEALSARLVEKRAKRAQFMCDKINNRFHPSPPLTPALVAQMNDRPPTATLGRPHFARVLVDLGHASSIQDAFERWLGNGCPFHVSNGDDFTLAQEAIHGVHEAGGVAVWAHPMLTLGDRPERVYEEYLQVLMGYGLDGIEVYHPCAAKAPKHTTMLARLAKKHNLIITGGSDFHSVLRNNIGEPRVKAQDVIPALHERIKNYKV